MSATERTWMDEMRPPGIRLEDPVTMCATWDNAYWCHGWVDKRKVRGELLSRASSRSLEGEEDEQQIIAGKVRHGWVITVVGDTSGCGWDLSMHFEEAEPTVVDGRWVGMKVVEYDEDNEQTGDVDDVGHEIDAEVADGPHKATWWSAP